MMKGFFVNITVLLVLFGAGFAHGYGGSSSSRRGGSTGIIMNNLCSDFSSIIPRRDASLSSLSEVSFVVPSEYLKGSIMVVINDEEVATSVREKPNEDFLVKASLESPLRQKGTTKISLSAKDQNGCEKNSVYFVQIDPNIRQDEQEEKEEASAIERKNFLDTESHWSKSYIETMVERGIATGYGDKKFRPDNVINRAEMVKITMNALKKETENQRISPFEDVPANDWSAPYILNAKNLGIVSGYWNNRFFEPFSGGTRAAALKMLVQAAGIDVSGYQGISPFPDVAASEWYAPYVAWAKETGIIGGYSNGNFGPDNTVTRGEMAKITMNFLNFIGG